MSKIIVAVSGPVASGKTTILRQIKELLEQNHIVSEIQEKMSPEGFSEQIVVITNES